MNGKSDRIHRTLVECARTMLLHANLNRKYWSEATLCASYLRNRCINFKNQIPAQLWFNKLINFSKLRIFGYDAYLLTPREKRKQI